MQSYILREKQYTPESFLVNKYAKVIIHTAYSYCKNSIKGKEKEKKRQERQRIYEEEEKIIRQIKELTR